MIPYSRQSINKNDIKQITKVLNSNFLTQGPLVPTFEKNFSKKVGSKFAVAVNSATSGLHAACLALNLKKGDIAWTVPTTFAATSNCILNCGASIDFVDIEDDTFNISVKLLEKKLKESLKKNKLPKVLIPVHLGGQPTDQKKIYQLSKKYNFKIIEDASHSLGAKHYGEKVGSCKWSHLTVFSFHPTKVMTTGEGGMITTNNKKFYDNLNLIRNNGITKSHNKFRVKSKSKWYYEYQTTGFNFRMTDIQAALGISQLKRLNLFVKKRNLVAEQYKKLLKKAPVSFQKIQKYNLSTFHLLIVNFKQKNRKINYDKIFNKFRKNKIFVNLHYMPLNKSILLKKRFKNKQYENAETYSKTCLSIPVYYDIELKSIKKVCRVIENILNV